MFVTRTCNIAAVVLGAVCMAAGQPIITSVSNAASFEQTNPATLFDGTARGLPRGCVVSIFGSRLAESNVSANGLPLPRKLANTTVTVGASGMAAPLYYVSPSQINALIPVELSASTVSLVVTTAEGKSDPFALALAPTGPGIFTRTADGKGAAQAFGPAFQPAGIAAPGIPLVLYATGLGDTDPPVASGEAATDVEPLNRTVSLPEVLVGEFPARVDFAGLAPGLAGVYQLNVVPQTVASDRIVIRANRSQSNITSVAIAAGQNVANASGTIQAIFPSSQSSGFQSYSPLLVAVKFTARMDILPGAGPFVIAAVSDAGSSLISVDPVRGSYQAAVTIPTAKARAGDFSAAGIVPVDFPACFPDPSGIVKCFPFPGAILPASRISPLELSALRLVPPPDSISANSANVVNQVKGTVKANSTFVIDEQNNAGVSVFGGYMAIPVAPRPSQRTTTLKLFIDGRLVASTEVPYLASAF